MAELSLSALSSPEMIQSALDAMPFGLLFLDADLQVITANAFLRERLPGRRWAPGRMPVQAVLGGRSERSLQAFHQVLEDGQPITLSTRFHRTVFDLTPLPGMPFADIPQSVTILPLREGRRTAGLVVTVQDVSDRVLAEDDLTREIRKLTFLHELGLALSTLEIDACMQTLVTRLRQLFGADVVSLLVIKQDRLELVASAGLPLPPGAISLDLTSGVTGWAVSHKQSVNIAHVEQDPRYIEMLPAIRSELAAPLIANGQCLGVIDLESVTPAAFTQEDLHLLELAAFSAATALYNAQVHAESNYWRTYYQGVVNQTGDIMYTVDRDLRLTGANAAWDAFAGANNGAGWQTPRCIGQHLLSAFSGAEKVKWQTLCAELLNGKRRAYDEEIACHSPQKQRWLALRAAPLQEAGGKITGIIFSTHDVSEHVIAEERLREVNQQLETLLRVSQVLSQNIPNQNIPEIIVETLAQIMLAECVTITRVDEEDQAFRVIAAYGASEQHRLRYRTPQARAHSIINRLGRTGTLYHLADTPTLENYPIYQADGLYGVLYSLIEHQGKILGSLNIYTGNPGRRFTVEEKSLVRALAPQLGLALENALLYEQLQKLATTDGLTGLINRWQLDELLTREASLCKRYQRQFSVLMIDLDHYKCYNDTFGHPMGDELLIKIARLLKANLRAGDIAARYGGDEFVVILPETPIEAALATASRLQEAVGAIEVPQVEAARCKQLTLSIGIASCPAHGQEAAALLRCADIALYRAKETGRNRIEVAQARQRDPDDTQKSDKGDSQGEELR